ncbi:MAG TPA: ABC transporter permease [Methanosarcinaceae archaeon]|nr:ABC transporter permease [Methanosarcinaceae archaeon]
MNRSLTVARHEFLNTVKRKEFIFMTFIFPLFFIFIMFGSTLLFATTFSQDQTIGYIDQTDSFVLSKTIMTDLPALGSVEEKNHTIDFRKYTGTGEAREDLISDKISAYIVIPSDFIKTGDIKLYTLKRGLNNQRELSGKLSETVITTLLKEVVDDDILQRVKDPVHIKEFNIDATGETREKGLSDFLSESGMPVIIGMLLFISIFSASGYLLRGVAEEKENRVIEVLLSSLTPVELLTGKIVGLGMVGLLQITIWLSVGTMGAVYALPVLIKPSLLLLALVYFVLGFLVYASIMAGVGAISGSLQESQQFAGIFTFMAILPLMFMQILITKPDGIMSVTLSMFPLTSPVAMMGRIAATDVPLYQIAASILILGASVYIVIMLSARLFRTGFLMYGKRPNIREIIRYMRTG